MSAEQTAAYFRYKHDPWAFLTDCVFTKDQVDQKNPVKRFPAEWEYLRLYVMVWGKHRLLAVPKSRRMTMSWTNIALYLHSAIFFPNQDFAFVSKKEEDAAELVTRAEFIFDRIPAEKIPPALLPAKNLAKKPPSLSFTFGDGAVSKIQGYPMGADQLRQFTFSGILGDECAFWPEAQKFYAGSYPTIEGGGRMTLISSRSPGFFQRLVYDALDHTGEIDETVTPPQSKPFGDDSVIYWENPKNKFAIFDIHYTANPLKRVPGFRDAIRASMPIKDYMVEYERNWQSFVGKPVFEDYVRARHESPSRLEPWLGLPLLCGWDFGHTPACVIGQVQDSRLIILREFVSEGKGIKQFAPIVLAGLRSAFPEWRDAKKDFIHYVDPAGFAKSQHDNTKSCITEMSACGIRNIFPGPITWEDRRKAVEHFLLGQTKDGANFALHPKDCPTLQKGFVGGYQYPEKYSELEPKGVASPLKNAYSHPHDALQYLAGGALTLMRKRTTVDIPTPQYEFTKTEKQQEAQDYASGRGDYNIGGISG